MRATEPEATGRVVSSWDRLADFIFELGMLRKTPRTGYQFLGSGAENVAEHSFRTAMIGMLLARQAGADVGRTVLLCLFHDVHEARVGDFNYVNRLYNTTDAEAALRDALAGTGLEAEGLGLWRELDAAVTLEARLAHDADQLDFIANLKEEQDRGNPYAEKWLSHAIPRLRTEVGRAMAQAIVAADHTRWWFAGPDASWWRRGNGRH
ncbi:phosphohydrolase [Thermodesulfomicrobium sp. WS]|uniref:HD domain-containing protein n=1 Tax=Thermodesulfomicrobium sp. WS TaxID=3004129 RepID=UPI00248FDB4C|nr:HD domain-containing protein [Thermodesulfomicrobium sp. WS]BDV00336.1 phosphohydrolase [Thermodesulfomicrobium sp. WS]